MSTPSQPQQFTVQSGNQHILSSWSQAAGATEYLVYRSQDNVTFSLIATVSGSPLATSYLDTTVTLATTYWYQVTASNGTTASIPTQSLSAIATPNGELALAQIRLMAQQRADRVNSQFVTTSEWNGYINQAMFELYDLIVAVYEDYFLAPPIEFVSNGVQYQYDLPNGSNSFIDANNPNVTITPPAFYKLLGCDLALNNAVNAWVTINKFNFIDRNRFVYPNTASTIYGVFNLQYRVMGSQIQFIPTPSAGQAIRLWYIPRMTQLLQDTDTTMMGISGWIEYVIVRAAKYALDKEESDTTILTQEIVYLKQRIEEMASNRDAGLPDKISDTNQGNWSNGWSGGTNGAIGGFSALPLFPLLASYNHSNHWLANPIFHAQGSLTNIALLISFAYFSYLYQSKFSGRVTFAAIRDFAAHSPSTLLGHVRKIVGLGPKKQMVAIVSLFKSGVK